MGRALKDGRFSDVSFECEGMFLPVHKFIVCTKCQYFNAMLNSGKKKLRKSNKI